MKKVQSLRNAVMVSLLAGTTVVWGGTVFAQEDLQEFAEALINGLPCIGRNAFEMPYFIERGVTGDLIDDDDAAILAQKMADVLGNEAMKQRVISKRKEYENYYNWDRVCFDIANVIKENEQ